MIKAGFNDLKLSRLFLFATLASNMLVILKAVKQNNKNHGENRA